MKTAYAWQKAPFIRLLTALCTGILFQWYCGISFTTLTAISCLSVTFIIGFSFLPLPLKYRFNIVNGIITHWLLFAMGAWLVMQNDIRNKKEWIGRMYKKTDAVVAILNEKPQEQSNSFKALASIGGLVENGSMVTAKGYIAIYFKMDSSILQLKEGSEIIFTHPLETIKSSGNPGAFDYARYCLFHNITHQVYLQSQDFIVIRQPNVSYFNQFAVGIRNYFIELIHRACPTGKESGVAEAMILGQKENLEKSLLESYFDTGLIHLLNISGMRLGFIFMLLTSVTRPLENRKGWNALRISVVLSGIWLYTIICGIYPSLFRAALVFSFLGFSELFYRRVNSYHLLTVSAFALLVYDPFLLWDPGFQLSFLAVLSLIIFYRPIYHWIYFPNKLMNYFWRIAAGSIAVQVLLLPVSIYYFHQFTLIFMVSNLIAIPLSGLIFYCGILLCMSGAIPVVAKCTGSMLFFLIRILDLNVLNLQHFPYAIWSRLSLSVTEVILLLFFISCVGYWFLNKRSFALVLGLSSLLIIFALRIFYLNQVANQCKLLIYQIPHHQAVELIAGDQVQSICDNELKNDINFYEQIFNFAHNTYSVRPSLTHFTAKAFEFKNKHVLILDTSVQVIKNAKKMTVDILVLSGKLSSRIADLNSVYSIKQVVFDSSVPLWKADEFKHDCDSLHIPSYNVTTQGAFICNL